MKILHKKKIYFSTHSIWSKQFITVTNC